jgi:lactate racemase
MWITYGRHGLTAPPEIAARARTYEPPPVEAGMEVDLATLGGAPRTRILAERLPQVRTVLVLTVDNTRPCPTPLLLPVLDMCEEAGCTVTVAIATGRHRAMGREEIRASLGPRVCDRAVVIQNDAFDEARHRFLGTTSRGTSVRLNEALFEHELVLGVGFIEPSYLAGFSGGRKIVMPGMAHHATTDANHFMLGDPATRIGVLDGNPVSEDCAEVAAMSPLAWIVNGVLGPRDEILGITIGEPDWAHRDGCREARRLYEVTVPQHDIVIASAGGHPYDCDMVQAKKAMIPAMEVVRPGGAIVLLGACEEGWGAEATFGEWMRRYGPEEVIRRAARPEEFSLGAHGARIFARAVVERGARVVVVTSEAMAAELSGTFIEGATSLEEAFARVDRPGASVCVLDRCRRMIVDVPRG